MTKGKREPPRWGRDGSRYVSETSAGMLLTSLIIPNLGGTKVFKQDNKLLAIVCGVLIIKLIKLIPIVGGFVTLVTLTYGLGLISKFIWPKK